MAIIDNKGQIQIGAHTTAANNLTIDSSLNNGTFQIYTGNLGSALTTVANVSATGSVLIPGGVSYTTATSGTGTATKFIQTTYEEGTWIPTQGAGLTLVGAFSYTNCIYRKIGAQVTVYGTIGGATSIAAAAGGLMVGGLPFTSLSSYGIGSAVNVSGTASIAINTSNTSIYTTGAMAATANIYFSVTYPTAA